MVIQEPERQSSYRALVGVKLGGSCLDRVDLETALYKKNSIHCFLIIMLNAMIIRLVICMISI